jgi:hypothetical protein
MTSPVGVVSINWVFQGILGMDPTERNFKIFLDFLFAGLFALILSRFLNPVHSIILGLISAHTFNWLFNGHLFVIGRFLGFTSNRPEFILQYMTGVQHRIQNADFLLGGIIIGKIARGGGISSTSDVDIRLVRRKGFLNGIKASYLTTSERSRALLNKFPLDLYTHDKLESLNRLNPDEKPIIVFDPDGVFKEKYRNRGYSLLQDWTTA